MRRLSTPVNLHSRESRRRQVLATLVTLLLLTFTSASRIQAQDPSATQSAVIEIFSRSCAQVGCHAGSDAQMGMRLEREFFEAHTVGEASMERPDLLLISPGKPDSSYLMMKVTGHEDIVGAPMPFTGDPLTQSEIQSIHDWIENLEDLDTPSTGQVRLPRTVRSFDGWKVVNLPTTRMVDRGLWFFLIGHRFNPELFEGYEVFYGLDGSAVIFLNLGYAPADNLLFVLGRSNASDNVELQAKYRFMQQTLESGRPLALAAQATVNWITETLQDEDALRAEAFKFSGQLIASRDFGTRVGVQLAPGFLVNQSERLSDESLLLTLGLGARWRFYRNLSLLAEWVAILDGYERSTTFGNENRFDSWGGGLEIAVGGHVFQIVLTNSVGLTTDQYMRGGDLDIREPEMRLGFNIFRLLQF